MDEAEQEQEKVQWLRTVYQQVPQGCPLAKRVKLSDVHMKFEEKYAKCSHHKLAELLQKAFPNSESKVAGKTRTKHIFGIQPIELPSTSELSITQLTEELRSERAQNMKLQEKTHRLEARIRELESTSPSYLTMQVDALPQTSLTASGPDSYEHFHEFTVEGMIHELQELVPDLYGLFMHLGDVSRTVSLDAVSTQKLKAISALCTMMNARSSRVKGLQLLISMMLIARSTSKQVHYKGYTRIISSSKLNKTAIITHASIKTCVHGMCTTPLSLYKCTGANCPQSYWSMYVI